MGGNITVYYYRFLLIPEKFYHKMENIRAWVSIKSSTLF